jgi:RNA polymerase sigma-70 factor (ECF subfamily)
LAEGYEPAFRTAYLILHNRHDAEEAVQDAFLRAWRFRAAVPAGDGVKPWLYRVVVNACCSKLRTERRHLADPLAAVPAGVAGDLAAGEFGGRPASVTGAPVDPEAGALASEQQRLLLAALARMPDYLRVVVALRYYAQMSEKEIAEVIHRRPGTVKSRLHEARARLGADPALLALAHPEEADPCPDQEPADQEAVTP